MIDSVTTISASQSPGQLSDRNQPASSTGQSDSTGLTEEEKALVAELKKRDREVRAHEQAHLAAAGPYAQGGAKFTYQKGPDGKNYATGGEVQIDTSAVPGDPQATLRKAEQIRRAANAPASPSSQDRAVASDAAAMAIKARIELSRQQQDTPSADDNESTQASEIKGNIQVNNELLTEYENALTPSEQPNQINTRI